MAKNAKTATMATDATLNIGFFKNFIFLLIVVCFDKIYLRLYGSYCKTANQLERITNFMQKKIDCAVGGKAVIEGVMMRSPNHFVVSVRKEDGKIKTREFEFKSLTKKYKILGLPVLRGLVNLFESMYIGIKSLNVSNAEYIAGEKEHVEATDRPLWKEILSVVGYTIYMILVFGFAIFLFKFLPLGITEFLSSRFPFLDENYLIFNIVDGVIKTSFFLAYLVLISLLPDIKRVFMYHGAEHKSIWAYELDKSLTPDSATKQTRFHPRCGTSFILLVILISILIYTVVPTADNFIDKFASRVALLPLIAGVSYEALKLSAKHKDTFFMKAIIAPGLWFQKITTREPDEKQLEVALCSLKRCLELERF